MDAGKYELRCLCGVACSDTRGGGFFYCVKGGGGGFFLLLHCRLLLLFFFLRDGSLLSHVLLGDLL